jgi:hypothetical protein
MTEYDRELEELEQGLNGALTAPKDYRKQKFKPRKDETSQVIERSIPVSALSKIQQVLSRSQP